MGTYEELKAAIQQVIRTNGNNEITGALLQNALLSIVNVVGANATFAGIATPNTNPGTADQNVYYLATEAGTYVNFGGIQIAEGEAVILSNKTGTWTKQVSGFATQEQTITNNVLSATNGYGFDKTVSVGTGIASSFQFPVGHWLSLKAGDKLFVELSNIQIVGGGAIVAVLWTNTGQDLRYQLRFDYGGSQPLRAVWTLEEDAIVRGITMNKNEAVESYTATLRFAGNNYAEFYENQENTQNQITENQNQITENNVLSATNGYGFDKTVSVGTGIASSFQFPVGHWLSLKAGDKLFVELSNIQIVGGGAIVAVLWTNTGQDLRYQLRFDYGGSQPLRAVWTLEEDAIVRGITMNKNEAVESYTATLRFAGNNYAEFYENTQRTEDYTETVVIAQRNANNYNSIREIVMGLNANVSNRYIVYVPKGRWFECDLVGKPYVKIIGEDKDETILYNDGASENLTPADYSFGAYQNLPLNTISRSFKHCVNVRNDIYLENLTIEVNDSKYCVHLDASGERQGEFIHCKFIANQNVNYPLGFGVWAKQKFIFRFCELYQHAEGSEYCQFIHNWNNQQAICNVQFFNCYFNNNIALIGELGSEYSMLLDIINCFSEEENPKVHFFVESREGQSYWINPETQESVTDLTLVPYSIKLNYIGTNIKGVTQQNRPQILNYMIGELKTLL